MPRIIKSIHYTEAAKIMEENFFGPGDWWRHYRVNLTTEQLYRLQNFPWDKELLESPCPFDSEYKIKETHFAFLGLEELRAEPLTIMKWHEIYSSARPPRFATPASGWYCNAPFAAEKTARMRWYLMPMNTFRDSLKKTFEEQGLLYLSDEYEIPHAVEEVTKLLLYHEKNKKFINHRHCARCSDLASRDYHAMVGKFEHAGLTVSSSWDAERLDKVGIAASRLRNY